MLQWTTLNQNFQINRTAQIAIPFSIKATVEFVARGASICGLDAGEMERKMDNEA